MLKHGPRTVSTNPSAGAKRDEARKPGRKHASCQHGLQLDDHVHQAFGLVHRAFGHASARLCHMADVIENNIDPGVSERFRQEPNKEQSNFLLT